MLSGTTSSTNDDDMTKQTIPIVGEKGAPSILSDCTSIRTSHREQCWNTWIPEIAALVFSIVCAAAIATLLAVYNGRPVPKIPTGITLNAMIAILATASKSALLFTLSNSLGQLKWVWVRHESSRSLQDMEMFDNASRGPFGAATMLFSHFSRSTASAGSLLIIMCLLFDPFIQQVVTFQGQVSFAESPEATLNQVQGLFNAGGGFDVTQAINAALWLDDFTITPSCPSSNCTWPNTQSVALVGECHNDDSWTLSANCTFDFDEAEKESLDAVRDCTASSTDDASFDTNVQLAWTQACAGIASTPGSMCGSVYDLTAPNYSVVPVPAMYEEGRKCGFLPVGSCPNTTIPFLQYSVLEWSLGGPNWQLGLNATRCSLDFYLQENATSIVNGKLVTDLVRSGRMIKTYQNQGVVGNNNVTYACYDSPYGPPQDFSAFAQAIYKTFNHSITNAAPVIYDITGQHPGFCILAGMDPAYWPWPNTIEPYVSINHNSTGKVTDWATDISSNNSKVLPQNYTGAGGLTLSGALVPVLPLNSISELYYQVFQELGPANVTTNLARSLTKMLHTPSLNIYQTWMGAPDTHDGTFNGTRIVTGQVGTTLTLVEVRWIWLILPYSLSLGGIFFLLYTIYMTRRSRSPLWKSSINALFYHGLDKYPETTSDLETISEMDRQATGTWVRLSATKENEEVENSRLVLRASPERRVSR